MFEMKATGIVLRIDDLGRIVIPKRVRLQLNIQDGDALEVFTTSDREVVFKPYITGHALAKQIGDAFESIDGLLSSAPEHDRLKQIYGELSDLLKDKVAL